MYKEDLALNNLQWLICHKPIQSLPASILKKEMNKNEKTERVNTYNVKHSIKDEASV